MNFSNCARDGYEDGYEKILQILYISVPCVCKLSSCLCWAISCQCEKSDFKNFSFCNSSSLILVFEDFWMLVRMYTMKVLTQWRCGVRNVTPFRSYVGRCGLYLSLDYIWASAFLKISKSLLEICSGGGSDKRTYLNTVVFDKRYSTETRMQWRRCRIYALPWEINHLHRCVIYTVKHTYLDNYLLLYLYMYFHHIRFCDCSSVLRWSPWRHRPSSSTNSLTHPTLPKL